MATIYLALGSNVGDSQHYISDAIKLLETDLTDVAAAPIYHSKAVGYTKQADFVNTAIKAETRLSPTDLLIFTKQVEVKAGRVKRFRWGPREIDIDIIFYDDQIIRQPGLHIPHIRFAERDFVLLPICKLDPKLIDPISKLTVEQLYSKLPKSSLSIIES